MLARRRTNLLWKYPFRLAPPKRVFRGGVQVRVSEDARRCSVFLGYANVTDKEPAGLTPKGTGFFVHAGEAGVHGVYLVTAAHVAKSFGEDPFVIRFNEIRGAGRLEYVNLAVWHYHSDNRVDVAITKIMWPEWADCCALPSSEFMTRERIDFHEIGPGDAAYIVGLFHLHSGKSRNLILVHKGSIALMETDEKIPTDDGEEVEGYLVECHALPGASGSAVYVRPTVQFDADMSKEENPHTAIVHAEGRDFLLGVWIAAWPGKQATIAADARMLPEKSVVPVGMGIVVPAKHISEILVQPERSAERRTAIAAERAQMSAQKQ